MPVVTWPKPETAAPRQPRKPRAKPRAAEPAAIVELAPAPPSAALLNAILAYADLVEPIGDGLSLLRVGPARMDDAVIRRTLGREAARLADVSVIWNEDEGEIHSVLDAAAPRDLAAPEADHDDPCFELTPMALAWIEALAEEERLARSA